MSFNVVTVDFVGEKNCFTAIPPEVKKLVSLDKVVNVFELTHGENNSKCYVTWSGETTRHSSGSDGIININGLYGNKLGIKHGEQVIIRPVTSVPNANRVSIEPVSTDDWEILEKHAGYIETHLMDQIRVVWTGQLFPVWVDRVCIFLKIKNIDPDSDCVILENETEVFISPKLRTTFVGNSKPAMTKGDEMQSKHYKRLSSQSNHSEDSKHSSKESGSSRESVDGVTSPVRWGWNQLVPWIMGVQRLNARLRESPTRSNSTHRGYRFRDKNFPTNLNFIFRVQTLKVNYKENLTTSLKDGLRNAVVNPVQEDKSLFLQQPTVVFVNHEDIVEQSSLEGIEIPPVFYAKLTKLHSPREDLEHQAALQKKQKEEGSKKPKEKSSEKKQDKNVPYSEDLKDDYCYVTVVVIDKKRVSSDSHIEHMTLTLLEEQNCLQGHVIVPSLLRRLLELAVTRRVWLQVVDPPPNKNVPYYLSPVNPVPGSITSYMIQKAFGAWLKQASNEDIPMVIFPGVVVKFSLFLGISMEFQITYGEENDSDLPEFQLLDSDDLVNHSVTVLMNQKKKSSDSSKYSLKHMLMYADMQGGVAGFDPVVPTVQLKNLGGFADYATQAIKHLTACLACTPINSRMFRQTTPGLRNGMVLITGMKGSGKSSLAQAVCRRMAELPYLTYFQQVDCRTLRGKRPDNIVRSLEVILEEAVWRQPSLILLEDLDHVISAPDGPEAEMSPEGIYGARVAEVLKDVLRKEVNNGSRIAVLATCLSRNSIHSLLTSSRGTHFIQECVNISPPNKEGRKEILKVIIQHRVAKETVENLDWDWLMCRTEGFVAKDLDTLVSRAVHSFVLMGSKRNESDECVLRTQDFRAALQGFTPASIRNVTLHTAGELGWEDVGGLSDVKTVLKETLLLPSKYPLLFGNSPLRLRSGLLLYGAPGTGKTLLAGVVAKECGLNFISIKGPELLSKYIGASEQAVRDTFIRAQSAKPCILFFDEFDSIAPRRGHDNTGVTDRVVNQLLTQLDGVEGLQGVYVLGATSRPDLIDPALLRPGRLDKCLQCQLPNEEERVKILEALSRKITLAHDVDLRFFAKKCEHFSGADLKALLYNAQLEAIHEVTGRLTMSQKSPTKSNSDTNFRNGVVPKDRISLQKVSTRRRRPSWSSLVTYIPKLEDGVVERLSEEMEERLNFQVDQIKARLKVNKSTQRVTTAETLFSPVATSKQQTVHLSRSHLLKALSKTSPSVSEAERLRFEMIYRNFVSSRGGDFGSGITDALQKMTLA